MTKNTRTTLIRVGLVTSLALAIIAIPPLRQLTIDMLHTLAQVDIDSAREYILGFGVWAPLVSALMMILQAIAAPLPAFIITFANAAIFGWWQGALLSWTSSMVAAVLCFLLARWFGRGLAERLTSRFALQQVDAFFARHGQYTILIARLLPFVSFDVVSYAAGLTPMKVRHFLIATGIGQLPATLIYSYVGGMLTGGARLFVTGLLTLFAVSVLVFFLKSIYPNTHSERKTLLRNPLP